MNGSLIDPPALTDGGTDEITNITVRRGTHKATGEINVPTVNTVDSLPELVDKPLTEVVVCPPCVPVHHNPVAIHGDAFPKIIFLVYDGAVAFCLFKNEAPEPACIDREPVHENPLEKDDDGPVMKRVVKVHSGKSHYIPGR